MPVTDCTGFQLPLTQRVAYLTVYQPQLWREGEPKLKAESNQASAMRCCSLVFTAPLQHVLVSSDKPSSEVPWPVDLRQVGVVYTISLQVQLIYM
jgi:hypothetical protein